MGIYDATSASRTLAAQGGANPKGERVTANIQAQHFKTVAANTARTSAGDKLHRGPDNTLSIGDSKIKVTSDRIMINDGHEDHSISSGKFEDNHKDGIIRSDKLTISATVNKDTHKFNTVAFTTKDGKGWQYQFDKEGNMIGLHSVPSHASRAPGTGAPHHRTSNGAHGSALNPKGARGPAHSPINAGRRGGHAAHNPTRGAGAHGGQHAADPYTAVTHMLAGVRNGQNGVGQLHDAFKQFAKSIGGGDYKHFQTAVTGHSYLQNLPQQLRGLAKWLREQGRLEDANEVEQDADQIDPSSA